MSGLTRDGTGEPDSKDHIIFRRERGQGIKHFSCSADHEEHWQPCPVDSFSILCSSDHVQCWQPYPAGLYSAKS